MIYIICTKMNLVFQFAKQHDYILKFKKAEELLNDPPRPPKSRLEFGGYEWSDSDDISSSNDDNDIKSDLSDSSHGNNLGVTDERRGPSV